MFQVTRRFRSLSVVAIVVLTLTNVLVSLRLLNVSCPESSPNNSPQPNNRRLTSPAPKRHVTKAIPQHRQHILSDVGAEEVAIAAPCNDAGADQAAPLQAESFKSTLLNVDLRLGRWDSRRLYRLFDHVLVGERFAELSDNSKVTLATQTSVERMQSVVQMAMHWEGPLSIALFAAGEEDRILLQAQLKFIQKCYRKIASQISFHLAFPREPRPVSKDPTAMEDSLDAMQAHLDCQQPERAFKDIMTFWRPNAPHWKAKNLYPQNHMRNLARRNCQTSFVLLTDVDIVPCFNLWEKLDTFLATVPEPGPGSLSSPAEAKAKETRSGRGGLPFRRPPPTKVPSTPKIAYVIPTFEVDKRSRFPRTKKEVIRLSSRGLARPFHQKVFIYNQYATNFSRWQSEQDLDDAPVRVAYNVTNFEFLYEPFYVAPDTVPGHDERFVGYGFTRNTQVYEMSVAGYQFQVLSPVFAVHWGLQTKTSRPTWREMQNNENRRHVEAFKAEIAARYGVPLSKPSPPVPPPKKG